MNILFFEGCFEAIPAVVCSMPNFPFLIKSLKCSSITLGQCHGRRWRGTLTRPCHNAFAAPSFLLYTPLALAAFLCTFVMCSPLFVSPLVVSANRVSCHKDMAASKNNERMQNGVHQLGGPGLNGETRQRSHKTCDWSMLACYLQLVKDVIGSFLDWGLKSRC